MARSDTPERDALDRLTDAFVRDILNMSDEDILAEYRDEGGDPERARREMHALFEKSALIANKRQVTGAVGDRASRSPNSTASVAERTEDGMLSNDKPLP